MLIILTNVRKSIENSIRSIEFISNMFDFCKLILIEIDLLIMSTTICIRRTLLSEIIFVLLFSYKTKKNFYSKNKNEKEKHDQPLEFGINQQNSNVVDRLDELWDYNRLIDDKFYHKSISKSLCCFYRYL